ncbi:MAG: hypothetical protein M0P12_03960 [Paludibacteraceae bacterium]|nr:hypothetical protein [Paludibacteraceae bacterium]
MGKSELLDVILRDIKELELIAQGMREMDKVPTVMSDLAKIKAMNVYDGFCHINENPAMVFADQLRSIQKIESSCQTSEPKVAEPEIEKAAVLSPEKQIEPIKKEEKEEKVAELETPIEVESVPQMHEKLEAKVDKEEVKTFDAVAEKEEEEKRDESIKPETQGLDNQKEKVEKHQRIDADTYPYSVKSKELEKKGTIIAEIPNDTLKTITNERFKTNMKSVNESVSLSRKPEGRFVKSLKKAINLNDGFRYRKELFAGDSYLMNATIEALDEMDSFDKAMEYVLSRFSWDLNSQTAGDFVAMLEARFS